MKTIHDTGINCLADKGVVAWLDHRKVFRNFPVAFWNKCWLYFHLHIITERWNKFVLSCAPHFSSSKTLFSEHHETTRQQTMTKKATITFNVLFWRFLESLQNCWQPTAVHKSDAIIHLINMHLQMCCGREIVRLQNHYRYFVSDYDIKQYVKTFFSKTSYFDF